MRRAPVFRTLVAACASAALFSGCGTGQDLREKDDTTLTRDTVAPVAPPSAKAAERALSGSVVFQITGLMLVVPAQPPGGQTHVLLPKVTQQHSDRHVARFAFGLERADGDLCTPYARGVCWVDLARWRMEPIGAGGQPATSREFPDTIIDITHATGRKHRVKLDTPEKDLVAHLRFEAGTLGGTPCSLARWRYTPVEGNEVTAPFANQITWEIDHPLASPLTLRFIRKSDNLRKTVQLGTTFPSRRVFVLLAHVPETELPDLVSGRSTGGPGDKQPLRHLEDLYDHLSDQNGEGPANRPIPEFADSITSRCPVSITLFDANKSSARRLAVPGIKTFGCVVGTGQG